MKDQRTTETIAPEPAAAANHAWDGAFEAFGEVLERMKRNPLPAVVTIAAYVILSAVDQVFKLTKDLPLSNYYELSDILLLLLIVGLPLYCLRLADNKRLPVGNFLRANLQPVKFVNLLAGGIIATLAITASLVAFVVPAIWVVPWFYLYAYPLVDKGRQLNVFEAFQESKRLTQDNKSKVWGIVGATLLMGLVAVLITLIPVAGPLLSIAFSSFMSIITGGATALLYRWLQRRVPADPAVAE